MTFSMPGTPRAWSAALAGNNKLALSKLVTPSWAMIRSAGV